MLNAWTISAAKPGSISENPDSGHAAGFPRLSSSFPGPPAGPQAPLLPFSSTSCSNHHSYPADHSMLYSLIYWECPKLKIIKLNLKKGRHKRPTRMSEAKTKTNLKKQDKRICAGVMHLRSAQWRIPQKAINFPTSFSRNTLRGIKLRVPVLLLSRFCMVWDTVIKTADTGAEYR